MARRARSAASRSSCIPPEMRNLAIRRRDQAQFLTAWGAEMLRVHLDQVEKTDLDTPAHRETILAATGGIPAEILKLIRQMALADDPDEVVRNWEFSEPPPREIVKGPLGQALLLIGLAYGNDYYQALDDLMRENIGSDLVTIGPDLVATGLVVGWNTKSRRIRRSALGDLVARVMEA